MAQNPLTWRGGKPLRANGRLLRGAGGNVVAPPGGAPAEPPPQTNAGVLAAQNVVSGLTSGGNVERDRAWTMQYNGVALNRSTAYWTYLRNLGLTHVRLFYPYRPSVNMSDGVYGTNRPSAAQIDRLIDAAVQAVKAGLRVFVDACDVMGIEDWTDTYKPVVLAHLDLFADRILARPELTSSVIAVGPVNEWAGGDNATYNALRLEAHDRLRAALPDHVLITGAANWDDKAQLVADDWARPADDRWIAQWHHYDGAVQSADHWRNWQSQMEAFSQRMGGNPTICAEAGFYDPSNTQYQSLWLTNMRLQAQYIGLQRPIWWAVTDGNDWRMNRSGSDPLIRSELEGEITNADSTIRSLTGFLTGDEAPPPPPPAGPDNPLEPTWAGAEEVFYDDFAGTALDRGKWLIVYGGQGNGGVFDWNHDALEVNNGLTIRTFWDAALGRWQTGGMSMGNTATGYEGFTFGQVSVRARLDAGQGYQAGFILWPADDVWDAEIDFVEAPDADKQRVHNTVHGDPPDTVYDSAAFAADLTEWHTHTVRWTEAGVSFYLDGQLLRTMTNYVPVEPLALGLQGWVFGPNDGWSGGGPDNSMPKLIQIAYVRILRQP